MQQGREGMKKKIQTAGIILGGVILLAVIMTAEAGILQRKGQENPGMQEADENSGSILPGRMKTVPDDETSDGKSRDAFLGDAPEFAAFSVLDDGEPLSDNQEYTGLVCNIKNSLTENISVFFPDGSVREEEVYTMNLNNIWLSVPEGGSRCFGVPIFSTEYYAEGEWEQQEEWHDVTGIDCPEFNAGMEEARALIREGYLQKDLEEFLLQFPELHPAEREYTLRLTGGGRTDRAEDETSWWELDYILSTTAENGEVVPVASLDITKIIEAQGWESTDDAHLRIWTAESGFWRLLEDGASDLGEIWISQLPEMDFSEEDAARAYVEKLGADFDGLLPEGADREIEWSCSEGKFGWYNYLIWSGTTDTYEVTLAIPLMEPESGGWYLASRIRKEARRKEMCEDTLLIMMQTFHLEDSVYTVREGDTLWKIYKGYMDERNCNFREFAEYNNIKDSGQLYPGQRVILPGR